MYSPESSVRKTGSYIYEEFMPTDGTDVKVEYSLLIYYETMSASTLICTIAHLEGPYDFI